MILIELIGNLPVETETCRYKPQPSFALGILRSLVLGRLLKIRKSRGESLSGETRQAALVEDIIHHLSFKVEDVPSTRISHHLQHAYKPRLLYVLTNGPSVVRQ